jgi:DNA polymerase III delta prime subunit
VNDFASNILTIEFDGLRVTAHDQDDTERAHDKSRDELQELERVFQSVKARIESRGASTNDYRRIGGALFDFLFNDELRALYTALSERARGQHQRLYLRLVIDHSFQHYPWEMLFDASTQEFLSLTPDKALYRLIRPPVPSNAPPPNLDLAIVTASPSNLPELETETERIKLQEALATTGVTPHTVTTAVDITRRKLNDVLTSAHPGVLHFMGHGQYDPHTKEGSLALHDENGQVDWVPERELADILRGHASLSLVILTACETARPNPTTAFSGVGPRLVETRVPAVIAMQYKLQDLSAAIFTQALYESLAKGEDTAVAVQSARKRLQVERPSAREAFAPVLYMRGTPLRLRLPPIAEPAPTVQMTEDMEAFVPPREFDSLMRQLEQKHRLLLSGPPGSGKTLTARMLMHAFSTRAVPYEVRPVKTPDELASGLQETKPILFYVEDPWGIDRIAPDEGWAARLPALFRQGVGARNVSHKLLVTTRDANLHEVFGNEIPIEIRSACRELTYDSYDEEARARILSLKMKPLRVWQQDFVTQHEKTLVEQLRVPLSIDRFIFKVRDAEDESQLQLDKLIHEVDIKGLGTLLKQELDRKDFVWAKRPAIFLWTQLCIVPTLDLEETRARARLIHHPPGEPPQVLKLIRWMSSAGWLKQENKGYRAHPTTVSGLEQVLSSELDTADSLIESLLAGLCNRGEVEAAYRIAERLPKARRSAIPEAVNASIRQYLLARLLQTEGRTFTQALYAARRWFKDDSPISLLVRALLDPPLRSRKRFAFAVLDWDTPEWTQQTYAAVGASSEARQVLEKFILFELPARGPWNLKELATWTWRLGWELTPIYRKALEEALQWNSWSAGGLTHGALHGRVPPYEEVLLMILSAIERYNAAEEDHDTELRRKARQGVLDTAYADHILESAGDEYAALESALRAFVASRRAQQGYRWILKHPRREALLSAWGAELEYNMTTPDEELWDFYEAISQTHPEAAWQVIAQHADELSRRDSPQERRRSRRGPLRALRDFVGGIVRPLLKQEPQRRELRFAVSIASDLGRVRPFLLSRGIESLAKLLPPQEVQAELSKVASTWSEERRAEVALTACRFDESAGHAWLRPYKEAVQDAMGTSLRQVVQLCHRALYAELDDVVPLSSEELETLRRWASNSEGKLGRGSLLVLAASKVPLIVEARDGLRNTDEEARKTAVQVLRHDMSQEARGLLFGALSDPDAGVRAVAVEALAPGANQAEQQAILRLNKDESATVRLACVRAIQRQHWTEGLSVLVALLEDTHDSGSAMNEDDVNHHVARTAAEALKDWKSLPPEVISGLLDFARRGFASNTDLVVHQTVLELLVGIDDERVSLLLADRLSR